MLKIKRYKKENKSYKPKKATKEDLNHLFNIKEENKEDNKESKEENINKKEEKKKLKKVIKSQKVDKKEIEFKKQYQKEHNNNLPTDEYKPIEFQIIEKNNTKIRLALIRDEISGDVHLDVREIIKSNNNINVLSKNGFNIPIELLPTLSSYLYDFIDIADEKNLYDL